jgi:hypothetical protein
LKRAVLGEVALLITAGIFCVILAAAFAVTPYTSLHNGD